MQSDLEIAQARLRQAWSTVIPHLSAAANYTYADISSGTSSIGGSGGVTMDGHSGTASVTAKQILWDFGRSLHRIRQGRADIDAARWQALSTRQATILTVTQAYLTAVEAQGAVQVAEQALVEAQQQLKRVRGFADVGLRGRADVLTATSALSQAEFARLQALDNVALAKHVLTEAIGGRDDAAYEVAEPSTPLDHVAVPSLEEAISGALAKRPELRRATALEQSADAQMRATRDGWLPMLNASGGYTGRKIESADLTNTWSVTVGATWDVWDGGLTAAQAAETEAQVRRRRAEAQESTLAVTREVQEAWLRVREFQEHVQVAQQMVAEAEERLRLVEGRHATGLSSTLEVTDALHNVADAKQLLLAARTDAYVAHIQFRYALGEEL